MNVEKNDRERYNRWTSNPGKINKKKMSKSFVQRKVNRNYKHKTVFFKSKEMSF